MTSSRCARQNEEYRKLRETLAGPTYETKNSTVIGYFYSNDEYVISELACCATKNRVRLTCETLSSTLQTNRGSLGRAERHIIVQGCTWKMRVLCAVACCTCSMDTAANRTFVMGAARTSATPMVPCGECVLPKVKSTWVPPMRQVRLSC